MQRSRRTAVTAAKAIETGIILSIVGMKKLFCLMRKVPDQIVATIMLHQAAVKNLGKV